MILLCFIRYFISKIIALHLSACVPSLLSLWPLQWRCLAWSISIVCEDTVYVGTVPYGVLGTLQVEGCSTTLRAHCLVGILGTACRLHQWWQLHSTTVFLFVTRFVNLSISRFVNYVITRFVNYFSSRFINLFFSRLFNFIISRFVNLTKW